jgi:hypothetical protein
MKWFRPLLAVLLVLVGLTVVVFLARRHQPRSQAATAPVTAAATPIPGHLVLFFPGNDTLLHRETREVPELPTGVGARVRLVVEELVAGSREGYAPAFPWAAAVQAVFVDREGNAYVDLTPPPADAIAGTDAELALAYATTNSVVANCPGVERLQLLFGGQQVATLGHLDFSRPLAPKLDLVAP